MRIFNSLALILPLPVRHIVYEKGAHGQYGHQRATHLLPGARTATSIFGSASEHHPEGSYYIEWYEDRRLRKSVGTIPSEVLGEAHRKRAVLDAKTAGIVIAETEFTSASRQFLVTYAIERCLRDVKMNKAESTFTHYSHALMLFKPSLAKATIDGIDRDDNDYSGRPG